MPRSNPPATPLPDLATAAAIAPDLSQILASCRRYQPQRNSAQTLTMTLIARQRLGASDERLHDYFRAAEPQLTALIAQSATTVITQENWQQFLGQEQQFSAYLEFFMQEVAASDREQVMRRYLPALMPGIVAAGLLPLMRLAFAIEAKEEAEIAAALAWWASDFVEIGLPTDSASLVHASIKPAMSELLSPALNTLATGDLSLPKQLQHITQSAMFVDIVAGTKVVSRNNQSLREMSLVAVQLYWQTQHPLVLQMLTACYALRLVMPFVPDHRMLTMRYFWSAYAALYVASGVNVAPEQLMQLPGRYMSWIEIAQLAALAQDPHLIALIYACREEYGHAPNLVYWRVAQRALGWQDPSDQGAEFPTL